MIYHITENYSYRENTGPAEVIRQMTKYLAGQGLPSTILASGSAKAAAAREVGLEEFPVLTGGQAWRYPAGMAKYLQKLPQGSPAVLHLHGVWFAPQWLAARTAMKNAIPAILSPHGQFTTWQWRKAPLRRIKKLIYWYTMAYPTFKHLTVIQAGTVVERDELARDFPGQRLEVIPNALNLEEIDRLIAESKGRPAPHLDSPYLLFLGRLDPQKGVDLLIEAFARVIKGRDFRLALVGTDSNPDYAARLRTMVQQARLEKQVIFLGPVFGSRKWRLYQDAWACCLPSRSEGMSMTSLEVAAAGAPLLTTHESGVSDWGGNGGLLVHAGVEELARALDQVFSWGDQERQERGRRLRQLIERRYSWEALGPQWLSLYKELLAAC